MNAPIPTDSLYQLAPPEVPFYRNLRYDGGGMDVSLADFPPADRELLARLYAGLSATYAELREHRDEPAVAAPRLRAIYERDDWRLLVTSVRELGAQLPEGPAAPRLRQVAHDLKGGAFQALAVYLQLLAMGLSRDEDLHRMFFLARDQLKIMRNSLPDLDASGRARDEEQRLHHVELLVDKWQGGDHRLQNRSAAVRVDCRYQGAIAERCLEFSALDRVIYNLVNNATTHSADSRVDLAILPIPGADPQHLRFVVSNRIGEEQRAAIEQRFPNGPGGLFEGGFTTGGSGLGLRICADFVCNAYGLANVEQGLAEGHFGARIIDGRFVAWVHWPIAAD